MLEIEFGVVATKTFHTESSVTGIRPLDNVFSLPALLTHNTPSLWSCFLPGGGSLLIKCLSVVAWHSVSQNICILHKQSFSKLNPVQEHPLFSQYYSFMLSWHSEFRYSEACKPASYIILCSAFCQSNKTAAVCLSSQPHSCIVCN